MTFFKHHFLKERKTNMKISEILESGAGRYFYTSKFHDHGIELINNSPDELESAVLEMDDWLDGVYDKEYDYLQKNIKKLFSGSEYHGEILSRITTKCLLNDALL